MQLLKITTLSMVLVGLVACGGGGGDSDDTGAEPGGQVGGGNPIAGPIGTSFSGTTASNTAIADADVQIKSQTGVSISTTSNASGDFTSEELTEADENTPQGPYLLRVEQANGEFLYSIAYSDDAVNVGDDSQQVTINIHPYTDLIIRNWFARESLDIDTEFAGVTPISELPTLEEVTAISNEFLAILAAALEANDVSPTTNLLSSPFAAGDQGFGSFLNNSQVIINNDFINIFVVDSEGADTVQGVLIDNVDLAMDFTDTIDDVPSVPMEVRALSTDMQGEVLVVWQPSTDDKGVASYNVFRDGELIGTTPFPIFIDTEDLSENIIYDYTVEAVDGRDQSSGPSDIVSITLDALDTIAPSTATDVLLTDNTTDISLAWTQGEIQDVAGFRIFRGAPGNVPIIDASLLATVTTTAYVDFDVMSGTTYCYRIVTFDAAGNESEATAENCITVDGIAPAPSSVSFTSANFSVEESAGSIEITVSRSGDLSEAISVDFSAIAGTATADVDFMETSGTLNWPATDSTDRSFSVQVTENAEVESDETVNLTLSNPSLTTSLGLNSSSVLTITDAPQVACIDLSPTNITSDTTLSNPCYNVDFNISVSSAATLTIDPGVRLVFAAGTQLEVEDDGVLIARGTMAEPIVFTGAIQAAGFWDGLEIQSLATSELDHTIVEYGGGSSFNEANVGISFDGNLSLTNSTIRHSASFGIQFSGSGRLVAFSGNVVTLNEAAPIRIPANQAGILSTDNSLAGNITTIGGDRDFIQIIGGSDVENDQTWNLLDVDYRVTNLEINAELTLAPGITLVSSEGSNLDIRDGGTLKAIGTESQPITFTAQQQSPGFWTGIQIFTSTENEMDHTIVEYGGGPAGNTDANVGVFFQDSRLTIRNSILRHSETFGFDFSDNIDLVMDNVISTENNRPGQLSFNDVSMLGTTNSFTGNTDDRVFLTSSISTSQVVPNIGVPYLSTRTGTSTVSGNVSIAPGVEIQFGSNGGFNVQATGALSIVGEPGNPVILTGAQQEAGFWNGIQYTFSDSPNNVIDNAVIEFAGAPSGNTQALVGFFGQDAGGSVTNTVLRGSQTNGIEIDGNPNGVITTGNTFEDIAGENIFQD